MGWRPIEGHDGNLVGFSYDPGTDLQAATHEYSMARAAAFGDNNYYNDDEPTLEAEAVNPLENKCDFLEWQARLYWLAEPKIKDFVAKMAEGRGQEEEDRVSGIAWSRDEFGLKASCYARAEEAWNNTTG